MSLFRAPFVILDTETTGFANVPWSRVVELAAVRLDLEGQEDGRFECLVRPEIHDHRSAGAERIHGITRAMLQPERLAGDAADAFRSWLGRMPVTSFNVAFDRVMVERMGLDELRWASCVMERAMAVMGPAGVLRDANRSHPNYDPGRPWLYPRLAHAAEFFGVAVEGAAHRALTDARMAAGVACAIQRRELERKAS